MTVELWPCDDCREAGTATPGVKNLGKRGYCINHLGALYIRFDPINLSADMAFGYQVGPSRPDHGLLYADLACFRCQADWTGIPGEQCWWCRRGLETIERQTAVMLLQPPDTQPLDDTYEQRMRAWAKRMAVGVEAGLITNTQASRSWHRAIGASHAAA